jgi:hypothetical protein
MRTLLKLAVVALIANAGWHLFGAYLPNYKFQDAIRNAAQNGGQLSDEVLQDRILDLAGQYEVPVTASNVAVARQGNHTLVDVSYLRSIELAPGFRYPWPFKFHVEIVTLGSLK